MCQGKNKTTPNDPKGLPVKYFFICPEITAMMRMGSVSVGVAMLFILHFPFLVTCAQTDCPLPCTCVRRRVLCSDQDLSQVPNDIRGITRVLNLNKNHLQTFTGTEVVHLSDLRKLFLQRNQIMNISVSTFNHFPKLRELDISFNLIQTLPEGIFVPLPKLSKLDLSNNMLISVEGVLTGLHSLDNLDLSDNNIQGLSSDVFEGLDDLKTLLMPNNKLVYGNVHQKTFSKLPSLQYISLAGNPLQQADHFFGNNEKLVTIDLVHCQLQSFPLTLPLNIETLQLSQNNIIEIKKSDVSMYVKIVKIFLDQNELRSIENLAFYDMAEFTELWLSNNQLNVLPLGMPRGLKELHADSNEIQYIVGKTVFQPGALLEVFSVRSNRLQVLIADDFRELGLLRKLDLSANEFKEIPDGVFGNLTGLRELYLVQNDLDWIGNRAFDSLRSLELLDLSYIHLTNPSRLVEMGNFFHTLTSLKSLNLQESPDLAAVFLASMEMKTSLKKLVTLNLADNRIQTLPNDTFLPFSSSPEIDLSGNTFHCDTNIIWLKIAMQEKYFNFKNSLEYNCHTPSELYGQSILSLPLNQFAQPTVSTQSPDGDDYDDYGDDGGDVQMSTMPTTTMSPVTISTTSYSTEAGYQPQNSSVEPVQNATLAEPTTMNITENETNSTGMSSEQIQDVSHKGTNIIMIVGIIAGVAALGIIFSLGVLYRRKKGAILHAFQYKKEGFTSEENLVSDKAPVASNNTSRREERGSVTSHAEEDITNDYLGINTKIYSWDGK